MTKTFYAIVGVFIAIFIALFGCVVYLMVGIAEDPPSSSQYEPTTELEDLKAEYHLAVSDTIDAGTVDAENYISMNTFVLNGKNFSEYNEGMSEEYDYYNRYYVDNRGYQENNGDLNRYFYGTDPENPDLIFDVSADYKNNEWFVRKDYEFPAVGKDEVTDILLIDSEHVKKRKIESTIQRVDITTTAHVIEDEAVKEQVLEQFLSGDCMFYESVRLYTHPEKPKQYLILAKFQDSTVYQCVGYQME